MYLSAFAAALVVVTLARRIAPPALAALAIYVVIVAGFVLGTAVHGTRGDVSGEPFALQPAPSVAKIPDRLGAPAGVDNQLSVDVFANAVRAQGAHPVSLRRSEALEIDGWAFDAPDRSRCAAVVAVIDGRVFSGTYGLDRSDVAAVMGDDHRFTGFRIVVGGSSAGQGRHAVDVRCVTFSGRSYVAPATFSLEVTP